MYGVCPGAAPAVPAAGASTEYQSRARVTRSSFATGSMVTVVGTVAKQPTIQPVAPGKPTKPARPGKPGKPNRPVKPIRPGRPVYVVPATVVSPEDRREQTPPPAEEQPAKAPAPAAVVQPQPREFKKCQEGPDAMDPNCMHKPKSARQLQWEQFQRRHGR